MTDEPTIHEVILKDEIPKFRSGRRWVTVLKYGRDYVYLQCGRKKVRVPRSLWASIVSSTEAFNNRMALPPKPYRRR